MNQLNKLTTKQTLLLSDILLILVACLWGSSYGVAKYGLQFYPVLGFLAIRFGLTSFMLMPFVIRSYKHNSKQLKETFVVGIPLGFVLLVIFLLETYGVLYTSVANAAFLISLCIIITPFLEWLLLKKRPQGLLFVCAGICLLGTYLLTVQTTPTTESNLSLNLGDGLILLAAVSRGFIVVLTKKRMDKAREPINSLILTAIQSFVVFIGCTLLFFYTTDSITPPTEYQFWLSSIYLVVFCTIFAFFAQNWAIQVGTPSRASLLMGSEPLFGALFAVVFFGEVVTLSAWIGGLLIVVGSLILVMFSHHNNIGD